ncbi:MAG: N-acetylglucosamine-6-phosphate deacetylase [Ruminococcaceae bacterium]|nr:N-acetylglucosamine-6-phosphate deacetylase [Oscillospiraceae bacterium]
MKYIVNGKIVLPDGILENSALAFEDKIVGITHIEDIPQNAEIIDANGGFVAPGLVDIHIHGYLGEDTSDGIADGIEKIANGIMKNGVTSWCPTTMTVSMDQIKSALDVVRSLKAKSKDWDGAEILGVNLEGPFINPKKKGAQAEEYIKVPDAKFVIDNADIISLATMAPEMEGGVEAIAEICQNCEVKVSIGHTDASFEETLAGIDAGATHITHLFNAQTGLLHRNPGVVGAALLRDVSTELICDTFHIHKGLFELIGKVKGDKFVLITDCTRAGGMPDGEYTLGGQKIIVNGIECLLEDGTIAGSVLKLNNAVKNVCDNTDMPLWAVVKAASLNPAKAIGADDCKGSLEAGKDADIIITDDDFNIVKTIIGGKIKYES